MPDHDRPNLPSASGGLDRRRFVGLVTASVAASWLVTPARRATAGAVAPGSVELIPGYLADSARLVQDEATLCRLSDPEISFFDTLQAAAGGTDVVPLVLVPATQVGGAPAEFASGHARLWIHGFMPPDRVRRDHGLLRADLEVEVVADGVRHRHLAWSYRRDPVANLASPTTCGLPLDGKTGLDLYLTTQRQDRSAIGGPADRDGGTASGTARTYHTMLTCDAAYGESGLRPGVYALPLSDAAAKALPLPANHDWLVPDDLLYVLLSVEILKG